MAFMTLEIIFFQKKKNYYFILPFFFFIYLLPSLINEGSQNTLLVFEEGVSEHILRGKLWL